MAQLVTEKFAGFYCSVTEPQEFTQTKKKKRFYRRFGFCVHTQVQNVPQEISGNSERLFTDAGASSENTE